MSTSKYTQILEIDGEQILTSIVQDTGHMLVDIDHTLPVGHAGTLSTRTDNDTGIVTVATDVGTGYTTADKVNITWAAGVRFGMSVTASDSTTISVDGGTGTNLPAESTALVISKQKLLAVGLDGDQSVALAILTEGAAHIDFQSEAGSQYVVRSTAGVMWASLAGARSSNPIGSITLTTIGIGNGTTATNRVRIVSFQDLDL